MLLAATLLLGLLFVGGQYLAWRDLAAQGLYLATNPNSSFFYLLTGVHALHVLGGIAALGYLLALAVRSRLCPAKPGKWRGHLLALYGRSLGLSARRHLRTSVIAKGEEKTVSESEVAMHGAERFLWRRVRHTAFLPEN